ncbi:MAG: hypothetical protein OHK0031_05530 [Anaerolineales bacterium]
MADSAFDGRQVEAGGQAGSVVKFVKFGGHGFLSKKRGEEKSAHFTLFARRVRWMVGKNNVALQTRLGDAK